MTALEKSNIPFFCFFFTPLVNNKQKSVASSAESQVPRCLALKAKGSELRVLLLSAESPELKGLDDEVPIGTERLVLVG